MKKIEIYPRSSSVKYLVILSMALMFMAGCQDTDDDSDLEISMPVSVIEIKPGPIEEYINSTATVRAVKSTLIRSETEGNYRLAINRETGKTFAPGDRVQTGVTIIYIENPEYENNIKIESQKLNLDISKREYEKQQSLYDKGGVTLRDLKTSERNFIDAQYNYENALLQLKKLRITAPFTGTIINLPYYTPGTKISVGQDMVELMDFDQLYAEVYFPAKDLGRIKAGQELRVTHYALTEDTLAGTLTQVAPALDPDTRSFKAAINIENQAHLLRPGMFVKVETVVAQKDSSIVIPREVILSKRRGKTVFVVDKGAAFERIISTGIENEQQAEVLEGLKSGERLVVKGFETLRNRSKVKIVK